MRIISLLTDFGQKDPYVAQMKAVILSIYKKVQIVDITHEVDKFNITQGALILAQSIKFFPKNSIHVAVVDPGVGRQRRPITVVTQRSILIGPDNGLLVPAATSEGLRQVYHIKNPAFMSEKISHTFHGRDIFAPTAASLAKGREPQEVGEEIKDYVTISFEKANFNGEEISAKVISIDTFGNVVTNINHDMLHIFGAKTGGWIRITWRRGKICALISESYSPENEVLIIEGSHGFIELATAKGNLARKLKMKVDDRLIFQRDEAYH